MNGSERYFLKAIDNEEQLINAVRRTLCPQRLKAS